MESPLVQFHLTFLNLKHCSQGQSDFEGESNSTITFDLGCKVKVKVTETLKAYML